MFVWFYLSSRPEVFCKEAVFRNFLKLTGKHLGGGVFFKKFSSLRRADLLKRDSSTGVFSRFYENFQNTNFTFDDRISCKKGVLKNPTKFTAKFM